MPFASYLPDTRISIERKEIKMFKVAILQKCAIHAQIDKNIKSKCADDRVACDDQKGVYGGSENGAVQNSQLG